MLYYAVLPLESRIAHCILSICTSDPGVPSSDRLLLENEGQKHPKLTWSCLCYT